MSVLQRAEIGMPALLVVKVGSKILTPQEGDEHLKRIALLVRDISILIDAGVKVVLVSSGAVAHGRLALGMLERPTTIPMKQMCAGVGQIELLNIYREQFDKSGKKCGQILLTWDDLRNKKRYLNLRNTLFTMLENGVTPIINENDSVGIDEIKIGDNDTLAAQIALVVNADLFVALTDINGLYTSNPKKDPDAVHIPLVQSFGDDLQCSADEQGTDVGVGGMATKLRASEMICRAGITAIVGDGYNNELIDVINDSTMSTIFLPIRDRMNARDRFIAFTDKPEGCIVVDEGAHVAVMGGKSLLPAGICAAEGDFVAGDAVEIRVNDTVFAKGIVNYSADEIRAIQGKKSSEIESVLGRYRYDFVIHRNNLVIW